MLAQAHRSSLTSRPAELLRRSGRASLARASAIEALEQRQMMALLGVQLTELPIQFYNSTGQLSYQASNGALDVAATPTAIFLPTGPKVVTGTHGDFQLHIRLNPDGTIARGVNAGDSANLGAVDSSGNDLVLRGAVDLDGSGTIDPLTESGNLLTGEIVAFGFQDSGGPTDQYDYKFVVTGGLLAGYFTNRDAGVTMTSENSSFEGNFGVDFSGKAKGNIGPVAQPLVSSIAGYVYYDANNDGLFAGADTPIQGTKVNLTGVNDAGQAVSLSTFTLADGSYFFGNLRPGTYQLNEEQPGAYLDGKDTIGTPGGITTNDQFASIALPANYNGVQNNFGEILASSIAGYVYYDANNDGNFAGSDTPIQGTKVTLTGTDDLGNVINVSTNTLADGSYYFGNLRPGTYQLNEEQPGAYLDGKDTIGTPGGATSNDQFSAINLPVGFNGVQNNFGEILASSIAGYVYYDANNDGNFAGSDTPILGAKVTLTGTDDLGNVINLSTNTLADGSYYFGNLRPGTYQLDETQPVGYADGKDTIGTPGGTTTNDRFGAINLPVNFNGVQNNFGEILLSSIGGYVYYDQNNDGTFQNTESPIQGVKVTLTGTDDLGNAVNVSMNTLANGSYLFTGLRPGTYQLNESQPAAYVDGKDTIGTPGGVTSNDQFSNIQLPVNFNGVNNNFGEILLGSISGTKWLDVTGNGLTGDDVGFQGVTVYLDTNNNSMLDPGERSTVTGANGTYSFGGLAAGAYTVREVVDADFVRTGPTLSDHYDVVVASGQNITGLDFANAEKCDKSVLTSFGFLINGTTFVTDLRGKTRPGDEVTVVFTVAPWVTQHEFAFVSYTAPSGTFVATEASQQRIYDLDEGTFGPGTHTLTVKIPDAYYQIDFVCGPAIDRLGPAGSNIFYSAQTRLFSADNYGTTANVDNASSIAGKVYIDKNNNGAQDAGDTGLANVKVTLTGTNILGQSVNITKLTGNDGSYLFGNLLAGTYKVTETQPGYFLDGKENVGSLGGNKNTNDVLASISLGTGKDGVNYNFAERYCSGTTVTANDTGTIGFWRSDAGQNLIKALNGGSSKLNLGNWLANNFANLFGANAGTANNLAGKTNTQVAAAFSAKFGNSSTQLEAQIMATALSIYVSSSSLAGGSYATQYGFTVTSGGVGSRNVNIGANGSELGVSDNTTMTLLAAVQKANAKSGAGVCWSGNITARADLYSLFDAINQMGSVWAI